MKMPIGTVLLSKNNNESLNQTPHSTWNHLSIVVDSNNIVESQMDQGVIKTSFKEYQKRDYTYIAIVPKDKEIGLKAAKKAESLVGGKYKKLASAFRRLRKPELGENCVSIIRKAYADATGIDPKWKVPDDVLLSDLFVPLT